MRHGKTDWNEQGIIQGHIDTFLNKEGFEQSIAVAEKLKSEKIDVIFSSDLKRAYHTALIIAQKLKKKVIISKLLRERYFGQIQGLKGEEVAKKDTVLRLSELYWTNKTLVSILKRIGTLTQVESDQEMLKSLAKFFKSLKKHKGKKCFIGY